MPRAQREEGQWALGDHAPLNANEQFKQDDDGLNVRPAHRDDLLPRGLRRRSTPTTCAAGCAGGGCTRSASPASTAARPRSWSRTSWTTSYFMLRVRIDGGALTRSSCGTSREISSEFGRGIADVTDRQNIQYHWIRIEDVPGDLAPARGRGPVHARGVRRHARATCSAARVAGVAADEIIDGTPALRAIVDGYIGDRGVLQPAAQVQDRDQRLPRALHVAHEINDVVVRRRRAPRRAAPGFDLWVGGGLSTNPKLGASASARSSTLGGGPGRVGGRHRALPRLRLPPAAHPRAAEVPRRRLGAGAVPRGAGEASTSASRWPTARPPPPPAAGRATTSACTGSRTAASTSASRRGRAGLGRRCCRQVADLAEAHGSGRVRTTVEQKMRRPRRAGGAGGAARRASWRRWTCPSRPSLFRRGTMACTGIEFCKLAIVETKARAARPDTASWSAGCPDFDTPDHHQRQRLPELVRAVPDRRHRSQGLDRRRAARRLPGAPRRRARRPTRPASAASCAACKVTADELPDYVERVAAQLPGAAAPTASGSPPGCSARSEEALHERDVERTAGAVLLPLLRRRGPRARGRGRTAGGSAARACAPSALRFVPGAVSTTT